MEKIVNGFLWLRRRSFFRVAQRTFMILMPVATLGAFFEFINSSIFSPNSLIYNLLNFDYTMSDQVWNLGDAISSGLVSVTLGLFGLYATYFSAVYTARLYHRDATVAGISAVIVLTFYAYMINADNYGKLRNMSYLKMLGFHNLLFAMIIGYLVGQVFHFLGNRYVHVKLENVVAVRSRTLNSLLPAGISVLLGVIFSTLIYYFKINLVEFNYMTKLAEQARSSNNVLIVVFLTILILALSWLGIDGPLLALTATISDGSAVANMNYALRHGDSMNLPYKFLGSSLIRGYGIMGTGGVILALAVVLLLFTNSRQIETIVKWNLLPIIFNSPFGLIIGLPMILNPLFLLPLIFIPAINEFLAVAAISIKLIPTPAYPVLSGTPGILTSFLGTNGNWSSFFFTLLLFLLDIALLIPFVYIGIKVNERLKEYDETATIF